MRQKNCSSKKSSLKSVVLLKMEEPEAVTHIQSKISEFKTKVMSRRKRWLKEKKMEENTYVSNIYYS